MAIWNDPYTAKLNGVSYTVSLGLYENESMFTAVVYNLPFDAPDHADFRTISESLRDDICKRWDIKVELYQQVIYGFWNGSIIKHFKIFDTVAPNGKELLRRTIKLNELEELIGEKWEPHK